MVESGKMVETNTWSGSRYIKADGREASGWFQINGDWYYFATAMTSNKQEYYWASNGKTYVFNENGVYIPADNYAQGWNLIDGYYYYKKIVQPQESTELFLKGIHWKKQKITDGFDLTIYTETVQAAGHSSAKEAFARMMERQEGGQV